MNTGLIKDYYRVAFDAYQKDCDRFWTVFNVMNVINSGLFIIVLKSEQAALLPMVAFFGVVICILWAGVQKRFQFWVNSWEKKLELMDQLYLDEMKGCLVQPLFSNRNSRLFWLGDIRNPDALLTKLQDDQNPTSKLLWQELAQETQQFLRKASRFQKESVLMSALNHIIQKAPIYDWSCFQGSHDATKARQYAQSNPQSKKVIRLNRRLLENAYPKELVKKDWIWCLKRGFSTRKAGWVLPCILALAWSTILAFAIHPKRSVPGSNIGGTNATVSPLPNHPVTNFIMITNWVILPYPSAATSSPVPAVITNN
jgi:hypothetical protein